MKASAIHVNAQQKLQVTLEYDNGFKVDFIEAGEGWIPQDKCGLPLLMTASGYWQPDGSEKEPPAPMVDSFLSLAALHINSYINQLEQTFGGEV